MNVPQVIRAAAGKHAPADVDAAMMREAAEILAVGTHTRIREQLAFRAVHVQERFLLTFAKHKMRHRLAILRNRQPLAGGIWVGSGLHRPSGLDGKGEE